MALTSTVVSMSVGFGPAALPLREPDHLPPTMNQGNYSFCPFGQFGMPGSLDRQITPLIL